MVFNSIFFIFCFLPVFMMIYYLVPGKLRNLLLFLGSLIFYAWGEPVYVILMLFSSIFNYYMVQNWNVYIMMTGNRKLI